MAKMAGCPEMAGATVIDGDGATACVSERWWRARAAATARTGGGGARVWRGAWQGARGGGGARGRARAGEGARTGGVARGLAGSGAGSARGRGWRGGQGAARRALDLMCGSLRFLHVVRHSFLKTFSNFYHSLYI
jgi:hypothetical protein